MIRIVASRTREKREKISELGDAFNKNKRLILFVILFAVGVVFGISLYKKNDSTLMIKLLSVFNGYREVRETQSFTVNFVNSLFTYMIYVGTIYVFGLCAVGIPGICAAVFIRGLGIGTISGYMYSEFTLQGLGYCALIIYPGLIASLTAMFMCCNESVCMSRDMLMLVSFKNNEYTTGIKMYSIRYLIFVLISAVAALVDAVFLMLFSKLFNL